MSIHTVGVIGAGTMGNGIAQVCALKGLAVVMIDINDHAVQRGLAAIALSLDRMIKKHALSAADKDAALARITGSTDHAALAGAQLVIEAATENEALKVSILKQLDAVLSADTIIATNTSSISITKLAATTQRADRFIGMHFFNPVPMMALVEIIRGLATSDATHEAFIVLAEGLATPEDIDAGMKLGCNHPIGPLALADMVGLDVCLAVMEVYVAEFADSKYRPAPLLKEMVAAGWLGRKTGRGVYRY